MRPRWPWRARLERGLQRFPLAFYGAEFTCSPSWRPTLSCSQAHALDVQGWKLNFCALTFGLGVSQLAVGLLNWLSPLLVRPRVLPRLDYSLGIAPESRTIVVVPTFSPASKG